MVDYYLINCFYFNYLIIIIIKNIYINILKININEIIKKIDDVNISNFKKKLLQILNNDEINLLKI